MDNDFTKREYQHLMILMNGYSQPDCELCAGIRKKMEEKIKSMPDDEPEFFSMD